MATAAVNTEHVIKVGDVIHNKRYKVVQPVGRGGYGEVYVVKDTKTGGPFALKVELEVPKEGEPGLHLEIGVLRRMQKSGHFVRYVDDGKLGKMTFIVMQLVGVNLSRIRQGCPQLKFTEVTALRLAWQCLKAIRDIHRAGLLHRDIKPSNFAMGRTISTARNVYLLDFGMVRPHLTKNGRVRAARPVCGFRGTPKYASLNCHNNVDLGRVDDLWSWMYMLVEFVTAQLPWNTQSDRKKIQGVKAQSHPSLCDRLEPEWRSIYKSLDTLKYADEPPYRAYLKLMKVLVKRKRLALDDPFDWEPKGAFHDQLAKVVPPPEKDEPIAEVKRSKQKSEKSVSIDDTEDEDDSQ